MFSSSLLILLASAGLIDARFAHEARHAHAHVHGIAHKRVTAEATQVLQANAIQSGSFVDGSTSIGAAEVGQAKSLTSTNNFINNCAGKTLTNGLQILTGSCNGITMGDIPAKDSMVSSIIISPQVGQVIASNTNFNISVQTSNLVAGSFTNADATYYAAPQQLSGGLVIGHTHVTVQDTGSDLNPTEALDPTLFAFFKGINDDGNGQGLLTAVVTGGLPAGNYRVCTLTSSSNHQAVLMPVAQRGTSDDCTKFTVSGSGTTINTAANNGSGGIAAAAAAALAVSDGPGFVVSSSASGAASSTSSVKEVASSTSSSVKLVASSVAPFSNTTSKATKTSAAAVKVTASSSSSIVVASTTSSASKSSSSSNAPGKRIITIIETFFDFTEARGASCPSVSKSGNQFTVLEQLFDSLAEAAAAACGAQFTECAKFTGDGFSVEECATQEDSCSSVASTQSATATAAATVTVSIVVPTTVTLTSTPGSVIAVQTVTVTSIASSAPATTSAAGVAQVAVTSAAESFCSIVSLTVTVDPPIETASANDAACSVVIETVTASSSASSTSVAILAASTSAPFSNSTATVASASSATSSVSSASAGTCTGGGSTLVCSAPAVGAGAVADPITGTFLGFQASTIAGLDFGLCTPTVKFELGLDGRAATAATFQAIDPLVNKGQEEALNPAIIFNRIHDQLTNVCGANQAAKDAAAAAQVSVVALGTKDVTTADAWNTALGFAGANTNPDNAPQTGLVGHT